MLVEKIDLYKEFNKTKTTESGILTVYSLDNDAEVCLNRKRPGILVIPGGAYVGCSFREAEPVAVSFLQKGYNAYVLNYSCAPHKYPTALIEAGMAMCYIRKNAEKYHQNVDSLAAVGFSAGGHLCGCLATLFDEPCFDFLKEDKPLVRPNAVALCYPVISYVNKPHKESFDNLCGDNEDLKVYLSLENRVTKNSSPAFITSTFGDTAVPCKNAMVIASAYEDKEVPFELRIYQVGRHGLSVGDTTVYGGEYAYQAFDHNKNYNNWVSDSIEFFENNGFKIID